MTETTTKNGLSTGQRALLIKSASYASLIVALSLVLLKAWGWQATDSVSLLSSLADSVLDVFASGITFWAVRYSLSPADTEHRFGHGKSEGLAALVQAFIIGSSGIYVCYEAVSRIFTPREITEPQIGLGVIVIATIATLMLVGFQRYVGKRTGSVAISADAAHYQTDLIINLGVGLAIILTTWTGLALIDPVVGLIIAATILKSALGIINDSLKILLDHEIPLKDREAIEIMAKNHPDVRGLHDMKTRFGGNHYIVQFHVEMDPDITLLRSHEILDDVEAEITAVYPGCEIIIHADPLGLPEKVEFTN
ncbi:MAG: cation diffusion facilitator family transporter [Gammaproteobacteria bacterium]|nr:cation diffusion facilitator family transporter [Gammaproteobacteria bacterium]